MMIHLLVPQILFLLKYLTQRAMPERFATNSKSVTPILRFATQTWVEHTSTIWEESAVSTLIGCTYDVRI